MPSKKNAKLLTEKEFNMDNYEGFYEHHYFAAFSDEHALNAHRFLPRVAWALDVAKEVKPKRILDLGCLEGYAILTVATKLDNVELAVGVDLSQEGIDLAKARAPKYAKFYQQDIEGFLEQCKDKFDLIMAFEVMEHVKDPELVFKLIDGVLAPGGTVLISTPDFEDPVYGKDDEENKCHIRLYTVANEDYQGTNKYGTVRTASSLSKQIGKDRIKEMKVVSHLINCRYQ